MCSKAPVDTTETSKSLHHCNTAVPTKSTTTASYSTTDGPSHSAISTESPTVVGVSAKTPTDDMTPTGTFVLTKGPIDNATDAPLATKSPSNVAPSALPIDDITSTDSAVLTEEPTKRSTDVVVLTLRPTDNTTSDNSTDTAEATNGQNDGAVITKVPTDDPNIAALTTEDSIESDVLTKGPIDNRTTNCNGPTNTGDSVTAGAGLVVLIVNIAYTSFCLANGSY